MRRAYFEGAGESRLINARVREADPVMVECVKCKKAPPNRIVVPSFD